MKRNTYKINKAKRDSLKDIKSTINELTSDITRILDEYELDSQDTAYLNQQLQRMKSLEIEAQVASMPERTNNYLQSKADISRSMGVSRQRSQQLYKTAMRKLQTRKDTYNIQEGDLHDLFYTEQTYIEL